jgi:hypothetical protein
MTGAGAIPGVCIVFDRTNGMPNRILREGIISSKRMAALVLDAGWLGEVFYRRLMSIVDDFAIFPADPCLLRAELFARQLETVREADISRLLAACEKAGLIRLYILSDDTYLQILDFRQQTRSNASKYPTPDTPGAAICASSATQVLRKCETSDDPLRPYSDTIAETDTNSETSSPPVGGSDSGDVDDPHVGGNGTPRKESNELHPRVVRHWCKRWKEKHGEDFPFAVAGAKNGAHIKKLIAAGNGDTKKIAAIINRFLASDDKYLIGRNHQLGKLISNIESFVADVPIKEDEPDENGFVRRIPTSEDLDWSLGKDRVRGPDEPPLVEASDNGNDH